MESTSSTDKHVPPVPIKTYQWEGLKREREAGAYPWTHLLKPTFEGEITAEDVLRESTPRRSMSRDVSRERTRSRTRSPDADRQKILNLDSSPGSSRKFGEDGVEDGINIPNFSKEISLEFEDDPINEAVQRYLEGQPKEVAEQFLPAPIACSSPKSVSPKSILKHRVPVQPVHKSPHSKNSSKCCHPIVNKIKHIADKTLHKHDKSDKSPNAKRKKGPDGQEIVQLKTSPGAVRRHKFGAIKLGDSDEISKTLSIDSSPSTRRRREHIYEDLETKDGTEPEKNLQFSPEVLEILTSSRADNLVQNETVVTEKSNTSHDPSLFCEDEEDEDLRPEDHIMESLHKHAELENEALVLDADSEEPDIEDVIQNQLEEDFGPQQESPDITITEITYEVESNGPTLQPQKQQQDATQSNDVETIAWSISISDHEYEVIAKPPPNIIFTSPSTEENPTKADDEFSSTTSLEKKYLQHASDEEDALIDHEHFENQSGHSSAQAFQKEVEDRYFVSTPSTISRTECDVSTSQVDSSALENLPLKRGSRQNADGDSKLHQRFKEQREKIRSQAGKIKTKLQGMKTRQFSLPDRTKFKLPQMPERPKFSMPDRRKFSLPERPKFKKINISEKLSIADRKKFTLPDRSKFKMPEIHMPKFQIPEKAKINFSSLTRKKEYNVEPESVGSNEDIQKITNADFESRTYPRFFRRKKKSDTTVSSSPTLNRPGTPPVVFSFATVSKQKEALKHYVPEYNEENQGPREYGNLPRATSYNDDETQRNTMYNAEYDFDKIQREYDEENRRFHEALKQSNNENAASLPDVSTSRPEYSPVINEINNDEFFVRPKGISRENIEVRQYLSDEIREAFKMPSNSLSLMGADIDEIKDVCDLDEEEADPELYLEDEPRNNIEEDINEKDDGYYTFPPVRPSRAKKMKKVIENVHYIDEGVHETLNFSEIDIEGNHNLYSNDYEKNTSDTFEKNLKDAEMVRYNTKTLPSAPKRKKKSLKSDLSLTSLNDLRIPNASYTTLWNDEHQDTDDIIVYRTEHEYVPDPPSAVTEHSPLPPRRRKRSRCSHAPSIADDDRTSHGAESLTPDPNISTAEAFEVYKNDRSESPGYATVEKYPLTKIRRSKSKTPPTTPRRRKSHSSERKYYTVDRVHIEDSFPDRPPRKKSSTSMVTLESFKRSGDITQYAEIDEPVVEDPHKDFKSGDIISKMKDRPLPPPPRPPRGPKKGKSTDNDPQSADDKTCIENEEKEFEIEYKYGPDAGEEIVEIEVSTQTDPLPDDIDYELGLEDNLDISMSSSLRDIGDEDAILRKSQTKLIDSPRDSRTGSRSEKNLILTDPKIHEISRNSFGRTSPTVILVERRVSSPTRINEQEEIVTEASLTVQPIDIDENKIPNVPPLPRSDVMRPPRRASKGASTNVTDEKALEKVEDVERVITDVQLDNLVTQRLQVRDLDVGRLNVTELQTSKILVSEIEGMTLQVTELDSKSGHISVSGVELSPSVIDEIVRKFTELATSTMLPTQLAPQEIPRPFSREEHTQTEEQAVSSTEQYQNVPTDESMPTPPVPPLQSAEPTPPVRPPPPDLSPILISYLQDLSVPPPSFYQLSPSRERPFTEFYESQASVAPPPPMRRTRRRPMHDSGSSSEEDIRKPSPRRMPRSHEPTIGEAGAQFFRVCQNTISRTLKNIFNSLMTYISGHEDKKDVQMAMVIFLVLIAGLIMFGLSDGRTVHHHHWEFFNPPDGNSK